ncbi:MAG: hydroxymethylglutaryl-CoA reductase, degradative [Bdellovibrionales bacterium]|nr:hydroxymethylglutaryl-CoA reductase, degradative [Bdellovibrionales bacterium]
MVNSSNKQSTESAKSSIDKKRKCLFKGFSRLTLAERFSRLIEMGALTQKDVRYLKSGGIKKTELAEKFIENVIGYFQIPLGVATNFCIDGKRMVIPMAVEETSIIAAASKTARWINEYGSINTSIKGSGVIGQIQISQVQNLENLKKVILENERDWIKKVHQEVIPSMYKRGGGIKGFKVRTLPSGGEEDKTQEKMAVIHVIVDTCNAMGANIVNQVCEYLRTLIESHTNEKVSVCIVSNLSDSCLTSAEIVMSGLDPQLMEKIEKASLFAEKDPYRAATSNKGVMNGIDAVLIATGNDWRAVSAGVHAYSARGGQYQSITRWRVKKDQLYGYFSAPLMVGTVGGMTRLHPTSKICLKMLGIKEASQLSRICAAVGLVQNLGALRALTTVGIIEGHMKLHIQNLTLGAGAKGWEIPVIQKHLEIIFGFKNRISLSQAVEALKALRKKTANPMETLKKIREKHQKQALATLKKIKAKHEKWIDK